ncbi:MAG: nitrite/sulfite reductase [Candidatus Tectimicrobiota bacterium]
MQQASTWNERLAEQLPSPLAHDIAIYETQMIQRRQDKIDEKVFAESRLRRGVYGQRYDNGQRHDGIQTQHLAYPAGALTKGPQTAWDAPGMQRIKIPFGALTAVQMETLADLAEEYSDGICHVTTRQDIQLHFVHIEDTPDLMRRLAAVGITTQEACGNVVRNVTACPRSGVCHDESFDTTPYAHALTYFLLGHKDTQDFGRKVKIAFSGCAAEACGLVNMHDLGFIAQRRLVDGQEQRGFACYVGGGLGSVPHHAQLLADFVTEAELLPLAQAVSRVFARLGEKRNRARARLKFLVAKLGIEAFRRLVQEERAIMPVDERWTAYLADLHQTDDAPTRPAQPLQTSLLPEGFLAWRTTNVLAQRQPGYALVTVCLPLGDLTARQMRDLADITRQYNGGRVRTTVDQNIVLRWISEADLPALYSALLAAGLGRAGASTIADITACPGTDTCKLGIASSRGLAAELQQRLQALNGACDEAVNNLHIKVSGCFNSCGQHHIADLGFYGVSRKVGNHAVPHFQVVLGGQMADNAAAYGLSTVAIPSRNIPLVVERITGLYAKERQSGETFQAFVKRMGKARMRELLNDLARVPAYTDDPSYYADWGDPREYSLGDMGVGECAGEVVSLTEFGLVAAERQVFEAQIHQESGAYGKAWEMAYGAMIQAAKALIQRYNIDVADDPEPIVQEFRERFYETELFFDPFAGPKFAHYLFHAHTDDLAKPDAAAVHRRIEEAQLFIEAAYACDSRLGQEPSVALAGAGVKL